jgi:hypothetical protein
VTRSICKLLLIASIAACGLVACGSATVSLSGGAREYVAADYEPVLRKWTRTEHLIALSELDDLLTVTATHESYDFRWAYVVRYAQDYRLTVEQRARLLETALSETRTTHQFYVALYGGSNVRWTDLSRSTSAWIVRLIDDLGTETAPEQIITIRKPGPIERTYYPYTSMWRQAFRLRFPVHAGGRPTISPQARWFGLRFAGAQGNQELRWNLAEAPPQE